MDLGNFFARAKAVQRLQGCRRLRRRGPAAHSGRDTSLLFEIASVLGACQSRCLLHPKRESRHHVNG